MTWHHLNYLLGFDELGHEVYFLEDSGEFSMPYNSKTWACEPDSTYGRQYLETTFNHYGLPKRYCYYSQFEDKYYGMPGTSSTRCCSNPTLVCVSGVTPIRESRPGRNARSSSIPTRYSRTFAWSATTHFCSITSSSTPAYVFPPSSLAGRTARCRERMA